MMKLNNAAGDEFVADLVAKKDYKKYVANNFDMSGLHQFIVATQIGLMPDHKMLDIGCGPLTGGRYFITYLNPGNYHGIEPNWWLVDEAIKCDIGEGYIAKRNPHLNSNDKFECNIFMEKKFNFVLAHSIYTHAPLWMIEKSLANIAPIMTNSTIFAGTFLKGENPQEYDGDEWVYPRGVMYTGNTMKVVFGNAGLNFTPVPILHPENHMWFVATKMKEE